MLIPAKMNTNILVLSHTLLKHSFSPVNKTIIPECRYVLSLLIHFISNTWIRKSDLITEGEGLL